MMNKYLLIILLLFSFQSVNAQWIDFQPIANRQAKGKFLTDIYNHCTHPYNDSDLVTSAHESTHDVHSYLDNHNNGFEVLYCCDNRAFKVTKIKDFKLSTLANKVPQKYRGGVYNLYLVSQRQYFEDAPTYVLDEGIAYQNGVIVGLETHAPGNRSSDSLDHALEMNIYSIFLAKMANHEDLYYFVTWQAKRNIELYNRVKTCGDSGIIYDHMLQRYKLFQQAIGETQQGQ